MKVMGVYPEVGMVPFDLASGGQQHWEMLTRLFNCSRMLFLSPQGSVSQHLDATELKHI
jgi:hypothetical protein